MPGAVIAGLLISSLLLIHFSIRRRPLPPDKPLDVDEGLPWPEAAQASTVFSLTALFGAYLGVYLILGLPALLGLACGTVIALIGLKEWIGRRGCDSFESFLSVVLPSRRANAAVFGLLLVAVQCAFAMSELLILREIAKTALGFRPQHATLFVLALGVIGYFYLLFGGYLALFRTDVLQFLMLAVMGSALAIVAVNGLATGSLHPHLWPRAGYWIVPGIRSAGVTFVYQFLIAAVMGFGFITGSPDAWKRVFLVTKQSGRRVRFVVFLLVGIAPFLLLVPMSALGPALPDGPVDTRALLDGMLSSNGLFIAASLGLVASFLSSFNSALLASVQIGLILRRRSTSTDELKTFHWLMAVNLLIVTFGFLALLSTGNPYFLANVLLGPYAVVAGVQLGSFGFVSKMREGALLWVAVLSLLAWFLYISSGEPIAAVPNTFELNTIPAGVMLFILVTSASWLLRSRRVTR